MARALIVGCGCRGRGLGRALVAEGWVVRGTSRTEAGVEAIEAAGLEGVTADPDRIGTVLDAIEGVALVYWLFGSASGTAEQVAALHGPRLERLLEEIVDTPVRGLVYEFGPELSMEIAETAFGLLGEAGERWRIPFEAVDGSPGSEELWLDGMLGAARELIG